VLKPLIVIPPKIRFFVPSPPILGEGSQYHGVFAIDDEQARPDVWAVEEAPMQRQCWVGFTLPIGKRASPNRNPPYSL